MTDFAGKEMARMVDQAQQTRIVLEAWKQYCLKEPTIVFCSNIEHACDVSRTVSHHGVCSVSLCNIQTRTRHSYIWAWGNGAIQVIATVRHVEIPPNMKRGYCIVDLKPKGKNWKPRIITAEGKVYTIDTTVTT